MSQNPYPPDDRYRDRPDEPRRPRDDDERGRYADDYGRGDYEDDRLVREPRFPGALLFAGICWIVFGSLILLNVVTLFVLMATAPRGEEDAAIVGGTCGIGLVALFGGAFIFVGVQSIQGTAKDTLGNGIGSLVFALLVLAGAGANLANRNPIQAGAGFLFGAGLLGAGVAALVGRGDYVAWRRARKAARRERRRD